MLEYGTEYYQELDAPDQRAALMSFYYSTGGAYWNPRLVSNAEQQQFSQLVAELEEAGYDSSGQQLNVSSLPADLVSDLANLPALSVNCALQQWLSFGQLLLKHQWGSSVSYCHWYGVSCCKTSVRLWTACFHMHSPIIITNMCNADVVHEGYHNS